MDTVEFYTCKVTSATAVDITFLFCNAQALCPPLHLEFLLLLWHSLWKLLHYI